MKNLIFYYKGHFAIPEVLVCFRDKIFRGNRSQICDSVGFDCVASPNFPVLATLKINILLKKDQVLKYEDNPKELSILTVLQIFYYIINQ